MIDQQGGEQNAAAVFVQPSPGSTCFLPNLVPERTQAGYDLDFVEFTAGLTDQQALVLWLMHYRGMKVKGNCRAFEHCVLDGLH